MKYRLVNFENRVAVTEQFFRRGLMRRFGIIGSLCAALGKPFDSGSLRVSFTRNLPGNNEAAAELAVKLDGKPVQLVCKRGNENAMFAMVKEG